MEGNKKKTLLIVLCLSSLLVVFLLCFNQQHRNDVEKTTDTPKTASLTSSILKRLAKAVIEPSIKVPKKRETNPLIIQSKSIKPECPNEGIREKPLSWQREKYILTHAFTWYLDGENKFEIAQTLAVIFDYALAKDFMFHADRLSFSAPQAQSYNQQLKQTLSKPGVFDWQYFNYKPLYNSQGVLITDWAQQQSAEYPDIAFNIWTGTLASTIKEGDIEAVLTVFDEIQLIYIDSPFSRPVLESLSVALTYSERPVSEKQAIIDGIGKLGPIYYYDEADMVLNVASLVAALKRAKFNTKSLELVNINTLELIANERILARIAAAKKQRADLFIEEKPIYRMCNEAGVAPDVTVKILESSQRINDAGMDEWSQGAMCIPPSSDSFTAFDNHLLWKTLMEEFDVSTYSLSNLEKVKTTDLGPIIKLLDEMPENWSYMVYRSLTRPKTKDKAHFEVMSMLVEKGFYPKNPNVALLIGELTAEQGYAIIKGLKDIKPYTEHWGWGLPLMISANGQFELAYKLVNEGYQMVNPNKIIIDPLFLTLYEIGQYYENEYFWRFLGEIVDDIGEIAPYQLNQIYHLKLTNPRLFELLIDRYPQLFPYEPEFYVEVKC